MVWNYRCDAVEPPFLFKIRPHRHKWHHHVPEAVRTVNFEGFANSSPQPPPPVDIFKPFRINPGHLPVDEIEATIVTDNEIAHVEITVRKNHGLPVVERFPGNADVDFGDHLDAHIISIVPPL